ncbi:Alpha/Beta hydrolase protein [Xylariales sp. AK1849]|nr:Alpha/Beta hydrolase protein [Xylariales sp. AK1849]
MFRLYLRTSVSPREIKPLSIANRFQRQFQPCKLLSPGFFVGESRGKSTFAKIKALDQNERGRDKMEAVARLVSKSKPRIVPGKLLVTELWFEVPLDYSKPDSKKIKLFARTAVKYERPIIEPSPEEKSMSEQKPFLVYLQGGPGFGNPQPQDSPLTTHMLDRGYELLLLDYRGVGFSCPVSTATLKLIGGPQEQADYLKLFRADNIVRDCEAVRKCLTKGYPSEKQKWSIFGQSFGGMTSLTYLSFHPEGLRESFITGGLVALDKGAEEIYESTFKKVVERNKAYYDKFPDDVVIVKELASKIRDIGGKDGIPLPAGGRLTVPLFLTIGLDFGSYRGLDTVHNMVLNMKGDLDQFGLITRATLNNLQQSMSWDVAPIYSVLHEPIWSYRPGIASNWAANRVGRSLDNFQWLRKDWSGPTSLKEDEPLYFSGEMVYPFLFDVCDELIELKETAQILAEFDQWPALYDEVQLKNNRVPVYAAIYEDMYVYPEDSRVTASKIKGCKTWETSVHFHSALRTHSSDVFRELLHLRDDTIN